jgi:two-component system, NarL family, nitrate/nitrite response regulator NarL
MAGPIRIAVVDDHPVVIEGVRSWVAAAPGAGIEVVLAAETIDALLAPDAPETDVALVDLNLDGVLVTDAIAELCSAGRRIVVYSQYADPETILAVLDAGACDFIAKNEGREHCVQTIVAVAADRPYVTPSLAGAMVSDSRPQRPHLSEQERTVLLLWFQSTSKESVARRMGISENTIRQYIARARVKYAGAGRPAPTKAALLARAIEDGIVSAEEIGDHGTA